MSAVTITYLEMRHPDELRPKRCAEERFRILECSVPQWQFNRFLYGLLPAFLGRGFGGVLLTSAIEEAWQMRPNRVWVHTCSLDHPAALQNYQSRGMKIYSKRSQPATTNKLPDG